MSENQGTESEKLSGGSPRVDYVRAICDPLTEAGVQCKLVQVLRVLSGSDTKEANEVLRLASFAVDRIAVMPNL